MGCKKINEKIDNGATVDDVSSKINKYDTNTFAKREKIYNDIINNQIFS